MKDTQGAWDENERPEGKDSLRWPLAASFGAPAASGRASRLQTRPVHPERSLHVCESHDALGSVFYFLFCLKVIHLIITYKNIYMVHFYS